MACHLSTNGLFVMSAAICDSFCFPMPCCMNNFIASCAARPASGERDVGDCGVNVVLV